MLINRLGQKSESLLIKFSITFRIKHITKDGSGVILDGNSFGIWSFIAQRAFKTVFKSLNLPLDRDFVKNLKGLKDREIGIYMHIPFCTGRCIFCPYVKYVFDRRLVQKYVKALKTEIRSYGEILKDAKIRVVDIHAGGGTPSLLDPKDYREIIETLNENFDITKGASFGVEASPEDITGEKASCFADAGIEELSIGVQSFFHNNLKLLGRRHSVEDSLEAIENAGNVGFKLINIDMMYMLPGQRLDEWTYDIKMAAQQDVDEVTIYPTLIAPYVPAYEMLKQGRIKPQPNKKAFKQMLYKACEVLKEEGYNPVEIYGFSKSKEKYATVNLEMEGPLLGLGAGAMGFIGQYEYLNTCSVREYIRSISKKKKPIAGIRELKKVEHAIRWAVCELFICQSLNLNEFEAKFGKKFEEIIGKTGFGKALRILKFLGTIKSHGNNIELTEKGIFTANQLCWAFVLNVPCRISEELLKTPWPIEVQIP